MHANYQCDHPCMECISAGTYALRLAEAVRQTATVSITHAHSNDYSCAECDWGAAPAKQQHGGAVSERREAGLAAGTRSSGRLRRSRCTATATGKHFCAEDGAVAAIGSGVAAIGDTSVV